MTSKKELLEDHDPTERLEFNNLEDVEEDYEDRDDDDDDYDEDDFEYDEKHEEDDDDDDDDDEDATDNDRAALAYLYRYEQMVRQQDAEDHATISHLRPLFDRLRVLGYSGKGGVEGGGRSGTTQNGIDHKSPLSYEALENEDHFFTNGKLDDDDDDDDDENDARKENLGYCEIPNLLSYPAMKNALVLLRNDDHSEEVMSTDQQLMMVLSEITRNMADEGLDEEDEKEEDDATTIRKRSLSFPEFLHCYKTVVNGMMVLQMLPAVNYYQQSISSSSSSLDHKKPGDSLGVQYLRSRTKDRSVAMLSTFAMDYYNKTNNSSNNNNKTNQYGLNSYYANKKQKRTFPIGGESKRDGATGTAPPQSVNADDSAVKSGTRMSGSMMSGSMTGGSMVSGTIMNGAVTNGSLMNGTISRSLGNSATTQSRPTKLWKYFSDYNATLTNTIRKMPKSKQRKMAYLVVFSIAFFTWYCGAFLVFYLKRSTPLSTKEQYQEAFAPYKELHWARAELNTISRTISNLEQERSNLEKNIDKLRETKQELKQQKNSTRTTNTAIVSKPSSTHPTVLQTAYERCSSRLNNLEDERLRMLVSASEQEEHIQACQARLEILLRPNLSIQERTNLVVEDDDDVWNKRRRQKQVQKQIMSALAGAGWVVLAPKAWMVIGHLGSATKIISVADGMGKILSSPIVRSLRSNFLRIKYVVRGLFSSYIGV